MRIRERYRKVQVPNFFGAAEPTDLSVMYEKIEDVNNGRKTLVRPDSPCAHIQSTYSPVLVKSNLTGTSTAVFYHADIYANKVSSVASDVLSVHGAKAQKRMKTLIDRQVGDFSTLNFLYELRELPDLFKKLKTPEDLRSIDWFFAIAPTISDIRSALRAYNNQVGALNEKLKKFRSIPCGGLYTNTLYHDGEGSAFAGNDHTMSNTMRVTTRMNGTIEMDIPILSQASPELFKVLDDLQIDISASNAWNALPWSWFVDWFIPVGDFLETLPSTMKPDCRFVGNISHKISSFGTLETRSGAPAFVYDKGLGAGSVTCKTYTRQPYADSMSKIFKWRLDSLSSPRQIAILRDIMFPADIQRGKSFLYSKPKKLASGKNRPILHGRNTLD